MADWGAPGEQPAFNEATDYMNNVTTGSSNNYGSWVSLGTPTAPVNGFFLEDNFVGSGSVIGKAVCIGIGASGSQVNVVTDLELPQTAYETNQSKPANLYTIPIMLPAGQEIWVKARCSLASQVCLIRLIPRQTDPALLGVGCDRLIGSSMAITGAGSYVSSAVVASAAKRYKSFLLVFSGSVENSTGVGALNWRLQRGAIGSEVIAMTGTQLVKQYNAQPGTANAFVSPPVVGPFPVDIPVGERFYFKMTSSVGAETVSIIVYGIW